MQSNIYVFEYPEKHFDNLEQIRKIDKIPVDLHTDGIFFE